MEVMMNRTNSKSDSWGFADAWLSIGATMIERAKREVEAAGYAATMAMMARTGGRL